jgi:hypothetical protein
VSTDLREEAANVAEWIGTGSRDPWTVARSLLFERFEVPAKEFRSRVSPLSGHRAFAGLVRRLQLEEYLEPPRPTDHVKVYRSRVCVRGRP